MFDIADKVYVKDSGVKGVVKRVVSHYQATDCKTILVDFGDSVKWVNPAGIERI